MLRRSFPLLRMYGGSDGYWLYPHGCYTPPHSYGAADNAVKRSIRKYHHSTRWVIALQDSHILLAGECVSLSLITYRLSAVLAHFGLASLIGQRVNVSVSSIFSFHSSEKLSSQ